MPEKPAESSDETPAKKAPSSLAFSVSWILESAPAKKAEPPAFSPFHFLGPSKAAVRREESKEEPDEEDSAPDSDEEAESGDSGPSDVSADLRPPWQTLWSERLGLPSRRIGHPYQTRAPAKHKKPRTSFGKEQVKELEKRFKEQKYLASTERAALAKSLRMSDAQVKTWFQNRRTKWRRQAAEEKEQERQVACRLLQSSSYLAAHYAPQPSYFARPDVAI